MYCQIDLNTEILCQNVSLVTFAAKDEKSQVAHNALQLEIFSLCLFLISPSYIVI